MRGWREVCENIEEWGAEGHAELDHELAGMYDLADALKVWIEPIAAAQH